jgi:hypothetical protein
LLEVELALLWSLRVALYIQLVLGLIRYITAYTGWTPGLVLSGPLWNLHPGLGILIAILALIALRPLPGVPQSGVRTAARFMPLAPLALGLGLITDALGGAAVVGLHMLLGIVTIALVEMAAARQRRAA